MRILTLPLLGLLGSGLIALPATAQQVDNTEFLPDAKPGECFAKVITPAKFSIRTEEIVIQEASERIETIIAVYETVDQTVVVKESAQALNASDTSFAAETEKVETRAREVSWMATQGKTTTPASPDAIEHIARSGVDTNAVKPGSCFVEYFTEAQYKIETQRVLIKEATQKITILPAEYETVEERVEVKEASTEVVDVPAVYRTETESVLVEPSRSVWQSDCGLLESVADTTGEVLCLVEIPARYETLTKTVLDSPAATKAINIPAVYKTISVERLVRPASEQRTDVPAEFASVERQVKVADPVFFWLAKGEDPDSSAKATGRQICQIERLAEFETVDKAMIDNAASVQASTVPARYRTVKVQKLVTPASERRIVIPARTKTVTSQVETAPAKLEWRQVLCQSNMNPEIITSLQRALKREGYQPGGFDGIVGPSTIRAIEAYQEDQGIDRGGITYEALQLLKVRS